MAITTTLHATVLTVVLILTSALCEAWSLPKCQQTSAAGNQLFCELGHHSPQPTAVVQERSIVVSRRRFWEKAGLATAVTIAIDPSKASAAETDQGKKLNLSDAELKAIVSKDVLENKFLATGRLTRSIYDESATFTDEIDTYTLDKWIKGTQRLFVGDKSRVELVGDIDVSPEKVEFRFDEDLMFNIPFKPTVSLTGKLILQRDLSTGLITSYREFWDQDVATVLKSAKF